MRTYRMCRRVLMFHHFPEKLGIADCLVRSTDFAYDERPHRLFYHQRYPVRLRRQPSGNRYLKKSIPPLEFEYTEAELAAQPIHEVDPASPENLPSGLDGAPYQWVDLDGEGLSGILTEQAGGWFYKRNLSAGVPGESRVDRPVRPRLGVATRPPFLAAGSAAIVGPRRRRAGRLVEIDRAEAGSTSAPTMLAGAVSGLLSLPNVDPHDPNLGFVDLTGDGHADILIIQDES